jgi:Zn-finger nucleic acid-binding protein
MERKQIEIDCPHCSTRILVDARTQQILRSRRPEELDSSGKPVVGEADWASALGKVQKRDASRDGALEAALDKERDRASQLDDLFDQAKEKLDDDDEEEP